MFIMKIDWKDTCFPCDIPDESLLSENDRLALNKELAAKMDRVEFLHQTGILFHYLKNSPEDIVSASIYRKLPCVSHQYAFVRGNLCTNIFTHCGREEWLHSSTMFVMKFYINNWNENTRQFIDSLADDESFYVVAWTGYKKKSKNADSDMLATRMGVMDNELEPSNRIVGVEVD